VIPVDARTNDNFEWMSEVKSPSGFGFSRTMIEFLSHSITRVCTFCTRSTSLAHTVRLLDDLNIQTSPKSSCHYLG